MANILLIKRGLKINIPRLEIGELGYTTDTKQVFIGSAVGNVDISSSIINVSDDSEVKDANKIYSVNGKLKYLKNGVITDIASGGPSVGGIAVIESEGIINYNGTSLIKVYCSSKFNNNILKGVTVNDDSATYTIKVSSPTTGSATWSFIDVSSDKTYITLQAITKDITEDCEIEITIPKYYLMFSSDNCSCSVWAKYKETQYSYTIYDRAYYAFPFTSSDKTISANNLATIGMGGKECITGSGLYLPTNITRHGYKLVYTNSSNTTIDYTKPLTQNNEIYYIKWAMDTDNNWWRGYNPGPLNKLHSKTNTAYTETNCPSKNYKMPTNTVNMSDSVSYTILNRDFAISNFLCTGTLINDLTSAEKEYDIELPTNNSSNTQDTSYTGNYNYYWMGSTYNLGVDHPVTCISFPSMILVCNALTAYYNQNSTDNKLTYAYTTDGTSTGEIIKTIAQATTWVKSNLTNTFEMCVPGATGYRLPTLAEYLFAAKAIPEGIRDSSQTCSVIQSSYPQYHHWLQVSKGTGKYPSNQYISDATYHAWCNYNTTQTQIVGSKIPNNIGLYDISGNVYERLDEYYDSTRRAITGGCYLYDNSYLRLGYTFYRELYIRESIIGFRFCRTLS